MKEKIAIIGLGCVFPDAPDFTEYWRNIIEKKCSIHDVSGEFWRAEDFYDPDPKAEDKTYSVMGATVKPIEFDVKEFGISPKVMQSTSTEQLFSLVVARQALIDAGYYGTNARDFDHSRCGVIISAPTGSNAFNLSHRMEASAIKQLIMNHGVPEDVAEKITQKYKMAHNEWTEDSNPGYIPNVVAGRVANRFDLGGTNCSVDAACGSSLGAVKFAVDELQNHNCDMMLVGGANLDSSAFAYISFCKTPAISKKGQLRPFDESGDGMLLGDGVGMIVIKRLEDAERDGDRIYAVINGVGSSGDGRAKSIYAPSKEGQKRALARAYENAGVNMGEIGLVEAHGTGTAAGDACEISALSEAFAEQGEETLDKRTTILGSVKSNIGHLRMSAGIAGLMKAALALHHKVFPATCSFENPNLRLIDSRLCVLSKPQAWIVNDEHPIRRAGVSAFGFGGTNYHVVMEEYKTEHEDPYRVNMGPVTVLLAADSKESLLEKLDAFLLGMQENSRLWLADEYRIGAAEGSVRLAFVAKTASEASEKAATALEMLKKSTADSFTQKGITYSSVAAEGKITMLFPGQGTQAVGMLSEAAIAYPQLRRAITSADNVLIKKGVTPVSELIYPKALTEEEKNAAAEALMNTANTQPTLAAVESGLYKIVTKRGLCADSYIGHSFGELVALWADGVFDDEMLITVSAERGRLMSKADPSAAMMAVMTDYDAVCEACKAYDKVYVANENSPKQTVVSGDVEQIIKLEEELTAKGIRAVRLNVSGAFHSPYMKEASAAFRAYLDTLDIKEGTGKVIANCSGEFYGKKRAKEKDLYPKKKSKVSEFYAKKKRNEMEDEAEGGSVNELLESQLLNPVKFTESVKNAYADGSRVFLEVGSGKVLSGLVRDILDEKDVKVIALAPEKGKDTAEQLEFAMAQLAVLGISVLDDPYRVIPNEELVIKKSKMTYTVDPAGFYTPEQQKKMEEAWKPEPEALKESLKKNPVVSPVSTVMSEKKESVKPMSNTVTSVNAANANAEVFNKFMDVQTAQLQAVADLLTNHAKTENDKKNILDCINQFQNNSLKALELYFGSPVSNVSADFAPAVSADPITLPAAPAVEEPVLAVENTPETKKTAVVSAGSAEDILAVILEAISDKTGYPEDMIEADMELEADLGVDSIKRVEIISDTVNRLGITLTAADTEDLSDCATADEIAKFLAEV